jgi:hypothetical protein
MCFGFIQARTILLTVKCKTMKTIFTLFASMFLALSVFADHPKAAGKLTIRSFDRDDIKVMIDGKHFDPRHNSLMIQQIRPGHHRVKIFRERRGFWDVFGRRYELVYNSSIHFHPNTHVLLTIDRFGRVRMEERQIWNKGRGNGYGKSRDRDFRDWDDDNGYDYDRDGRWGNDDDDWYDGEEDYDHTHGKDDRKYDRDDRFERAMSDHEFNRAMQSLRNEWFENNKLQKAKQIVDANFMTTAQVKEMVLQFGFENNKLELAKYAYRRTTDQRNYYIIGDAFSFSSSRQELDRYIRNYR